jgi:hypothetical protein
MDASLIVVARALTLPRPAATIKPPPLSSNFLDVILMRRCLSARFAYFVLKVCLRELFLIRIRNAPD